MRAFLPALALGSILGIAAWAGAATPTAPPHSTAQIREVASLKLGQLLDHSGPVGAAENNTARIWNGSGV